MPPPTRDAHVDLPPERAQPGMCAKLLKSLYGNPDAALNWLRAYSEVLESVGLTKGLSSPCGFFHSGWGIHTVVHGDDFVSDGTDGSLRKMGLAMKKVFSLKTEILGGDQGDIRRVKLLNRQISWRDGEIALEADPRHVEILTAQLGLENAKAVKTPGDTNDNDKTA